VPVARLAAAQAVLAAGHYTEPAKEKEPARKAADKAKKAGGKPKAKARTATASRNGSGAGTAARRRTAAAR